MIYMKRSEFEHVGKASKGEKQEFKLWKIGKFH
jgi:hypothetical protein